MKNRDSFSVSNEYITAFFFKVARELGNFFLRAVRYYLALSCMVSIPEEETYTAFYFDAWKAVGCI